MFVAVFCKYHEDVRKYKYHYVEDKNIIRLRSKMKSYKKPEYALIDIRRYYQ